jgi:adenosylcobinamide-phosphate synthase
VAGELGVLASPSPSDVALLLAALGADLLLGEPPPALHPVVWIGRVARAAERRIGPAEPGQPPRPPLVLLASGALVAVGIPALFALGAAFATRSGGFFPFVGWLLGVWLTKSTFALRALGRAAREVARPLRAGDLPAARQALRALCSRDAGQLDERQLAAGAVSSLAENCCDSFVAPLFFFALAGLPAAMFYRAVNTLDAMIGYHGRHEHFGKAAARLDDLLNFVPARLTALLLLAGGKLVGLDARAGWRILQRDGGKTPSPNGGRPMAAMAGLLGVTLEKPGHYRLGDPGVPVGPEAIDRAWQVVTRGAALAAALTLLAVAVTGGR